jgi:hypothetical protein
MTSETETLALHLVRVLYESSDGLPQQWRMLEKLDAATAEAIQFSVARRWVVVQAGRLVCLTDAGQRLAESRLGATLVSWQT